MGLIDEMFAAVNKQVAGSAAQQNILMEAAMSMIKNYQGGLGGMLGQLQQGGLADQVKSWVSTGQNMAVNGQQVMNAMGESQLKAFANQVGLANDIAADTLAKIMPQIVDKLTPTGTVPQGNMMEQAMKMFMGQFPGTRT